MEICLKNVAKKYKNGSKIEYRDIVFKDNKINIVRGENGSGKTTLLNIIAGIDNDYEGRVLYDKGRMDKNKIKEITLVNQKPYLFKRSVYENIAYPLKVRKAGKREIDIKVNEVLALLKIESLRDKRADRLSGGETQKVSLARGLVFRPRVLLLDEFTASIDSRTVEKMEAVIIDYREKSGANIIMVSHSEEQIARVGDIIENLNKQ